jgi:multiple sugar transport system permease protein
MKSRRYIWWWVLPAMIMFLIIILVPFITALTYSFRAISFTDSTAVGQYVGVANYRRLVFDADFYNSFRVTFAYLLPSILIQGALGLLIALVIASAVRRARILIPIMLLPTLLTPVVIGLIGVLTLNPDFGVIGIWLKNTGLVQEAVLGSSKWALPAIIAVDTYQWTPFVAVILTAGLLGLPREPYEAAQVDGANPIQTFFRVTMPLLWPYFVVAMLIRVIDAFRIFDIIWVMTRGGPGTVTESVAVYAYRHIFRYWDLGYGSALIIVLFVFISILIEYLYKALQRWQGVGETA